MIALRTGFATDVGRVRDNNEDELLVDSPLFAVADGMGGAAAGEVASSVAIKTLQEAFGQADEPSPQALLSAAQAANRAVWQRAEANPEMRGMGTTLVALARVDGSISSSDDHAGPASSSDGRSGPLLAAINVGDSRLYRLRHGELEQVSEDHNLVAELVAEGRLSKEEAEFHPRRNIMTRALGVDPEVPVDLFEIDAQPGDRYLLCSDGLSDRVNDNLLASLLRRLADPAEAAAELVDEANRRGGNDNITVVIVDVIDTEEKPQDGTSAATAVIPAVPAEEAAPATKPATKPKPPRRKRTRPVTVRVLAFLILLLLLLGVAAAGIAFYARAQYYVGFAGVRITIFQGQPGGLLWFKPTVRQTTQYTANDIESAAVFPLISGVKEPSLSAARQYVQNLISQEQQARAAATPPTTVAPHPTTTVARHPTTVPRRSTTSTTKKP